MGSNLLLSFAAFCQQPSVSKVVGKWQRILSPGSGEALAFSLTRKEKGSKSQVVCMNSSAIKEINLYLEFSNCVAYKKAHVLYFAFERHLLNYFDE